MFSKSCFFIGHADAQESLLPILTEEIERLVVEEDVKEFFFGNHGNFDSMVRRALAKVKVKHPHIRRILVLAYHPSTLSAEIPKDVDESLYPFDERVMPRYAIPKANRRMIDDCRYLIAYVRHTGKARDFLEYAQRKGRNIIRL